MDFRLEVYLTSSPTPFSYPSDVKLLGFVIGITFIVLILDYPETSRLNEVLTKVLLKTKPFVKMSV